MLLAETSIGRVRTAAPVHSTEALSAELTGWLCWLDPWLQSWQLRKLPQGLQHSHSNMPFWLLVLAGIVSQAVDKTWIRLLPPTPTKKKAGLVLAYWKIKVTIPIIILFKCQLAMRNVFVDYTKLTACQLARNPSYPWYESTAILLYF